MAEAVVPARVHVVNAPVTPVWLRLTVPVGVMKVPDDVSVTVTLQIDPWLVVTGLVQEIVVVVARRVTAILVVPLLAM